MDNNNLQEVPQFVSLSEWQKAHDDEVEDLKGDIPHDRKSRLQLIAEFMQDYSRCGGAKHSKNAVAIYLALFRPPYPPSSAPFSTLEKVFIKDLKSRTHHLGKYVMLRRVTPALCMTSVTAIGEDERGDAIPFDIWHQEDSGRDAIITGTVCVIKEPFLEEAPGEYFINVYHISDIFWLSNEDQRTPSMWISQSAMLKDAKSLKVEGNVAIEAGLNQKALDTYTSALKTSKTQDEACIIQLNRSLAYLRLGQFDSAIQDIRSLNAEAQRSEKAFFRAACASYGLGRYSDCYKTLQEMLSVYPTSKSGKKEMERTERRLREQDDGEYDIKAMYKAAVKTPPRLDHANFTGSIEIKESRVHGKGVFTTDDIAAGDLLLCEKSFAQCSIADEVDPQFSAKSDFEAEIHEKRLWLRELAGIVSTIAQKLHRNPSLMTAFMSLCHDDLAPKGPTTVDDAPVIDSFLLSRIFTLDAFESNRCSLFEHLSNMGRNVSIDDYTHCSLFITASFFNHDCFPNARRSFIGDLILIHATRDIKAGTEVCLQYKFVSPKASYEELKGNFQNWGFVCTCNICEDRKQTGTILQERLALLEELDSILIQILRNLKSSKFLADKVVDISKALRIASAVEDTYRVPASDVPRLSLTVPYFTLVRVCHTQQKWAHVVSLAWKLLSSVGFVAKRSRGSSLTSEFKLIKWGYINNYVVETWVFLHIAYAQLAPQLCSQVEEYARISYKICVGENVTFEENHGQLMGKIGHQGGDLMDGMVKLIIK